MTFVEMQVKWSVTLTDRLGPEILTVLEIKGQVLHRVRLHVKVPGWLLNLNALLTKKLPKFLSPNWVHFLHTELMNASHSTNFFTNSYDHISTNGKAFIHSHINHNTPQFLYSL